MNDAPPRHDYLPIADHGIIGDLHSAALVGTEGTIDWFCPNRFDGPSVFAAILDAVRGGFFRITPIQCKWTSKQLYVPDTNVLITRFLSEEGVGEVIDFMPIDVRHQGTHRQRLVRRVLCVKGGLHFCAEVEPRFDYGRVEADIAVTDGGAVFGSPDLTLSLSAHSPLERTKEGVRATFVLDQGQSATFVLEQGEQPRPYSEDDTRELLNETVDYWLRWISAARYQGRWREIVRRSALTLKLLTYQPSGALIAAATTSLPEQLGGGRNWDYRFTWIRDAAFSIYALLRLGFTEEAAAFGGWLTDRFREGHKGESGPLQVMYAIDGGAELTEEILDHLGGLLRLRAGTDRQRRRRPASTGHLRRARRLRLSLQQVRNADLPRCLDGSVFDRRLGLEELGSAGRGHLGDPRRPPALHVLAAHVLGRCRAGSPRRTATWPAGRSRRLDEDARRHLPPDHGEGLERGARRVRAALRLGRARRFEPPHAAREVRLTHRSTLALDARPHDATSSSRTRSSTATT